MIRIMTHNVWNKDENNPEWQNKGLDCSAAARISGILQIYKDKLPDVIGGQEVSFLMTGLIMDNTDFALINGDYTPIFYNKEKLDLIESFFEIYPETISGFEGTFNDSKSKSYCIAVFSEKESGKRFIFANTHLWWKTSNIAKKGTHDYQAFSDEARAYQMSLLIEKLESFTNKYNCPAIVAGDLNTNYNSLVIKLLEEKGYMHAHNIATDYVDETMGYHYCFPDGYKDYYYDKPFEYAIDHILLKGENQDLIKGFYRYSPEYYLPISDHSPAFIDLKL